MNYIIVFLLGALTASLIITTLRVWEILQYLPI